MATGGPHEGNMEVFSDIYKAELDQRYELLQRELRDLEVKKLVFGNQERDFEQRVDAFEKNIAHIRESLQEEKQKLETKTQDLEKRECHFEDQQKKLTNHVDELTTNSQKGRDNFVSTQLLDEHRVKIELENRELQKQRQEIQDEWNKIKETQIANCEMAKNLNKTQEKVGDLWKALQVSKERSTEEINNLKRDLERQKLEFIESKEQTERELTAEKQALRDEKERLNAGKITLQNQIVEFQTESEQIRQILLKDKLDVQLLRENLQEDKLEVMKTAEGFLKDFNESLQDLKENLEILSLEKRSLEEEKQRFLMTKSESEKEQGRIYKILEEELDNLHLGKQSLETQVMDFREEIAAAGKILKEKETALEEGLEGLRLQRETLEEEKTNFQLTKFRSEEENKEIQAYLQQELKKLRVGQQSLDKQMMESEQRDVNSEQIIQDIQRVLQEERDCLVTLRQNVEEEKQRFLITKSESEKEQGRIYKILEEELDNLHLGKQSLETQVTDFREEIAAAGKILKEKETALEEGLEGLRLQRETLEEEKTNFQLTKFRSEEENKEIQAKELEIFQIRQQTLIKQMTDSEERNINSEQVIQDIQRVLQEERDCLVTLRQNLEEEKQRFLITKSESEKEQGRIHKFLQEELENLCLGKQSLETQVTDFREEIAAAGKILKEKETALEEGLEGLRLQRETLEEEKTNFQLTKFRSEEGNKEIQAKELEIFQIRQQTLIKQMTDSEERNINSEQVIQDIQRVLQEERDCLVTLPQNLEQDILEFMEKREAETHLLKEKQQALEEGVELSTQDVINSLEARMDEIDRHVGQCFLLLQEEEGHLGQIGQELEAAFLNVEDELPPVEDESDSPTAASEDLGELSLEKTVTTQVPSDGNPTLHSPHDDDDVRELSLEKTKTNSEEEHKEKYECFLDEFQYLEAGNQSLEEQKMDSQENEKDSAQIHQEAQTLADHVLGTGYLLGTQYLGTQQWVRGHLLLGTRYRGPGYAVCPHNDETQMIELREEMQKAYLNVEDEQPPVEDESDSPTAVSEDLGELNLEKTVTTQVTSDGNPTVPSLHDDNDELPENPGPAHESAEEDWEAEEPTPSTSGLGSSWD
nr:trichohyalin-like [Nothobranchius furzeri]